MPTRLKLRRRNGLSKSRYLVSPLISKRTPQTKNIGRLVADFWPFEFVCGGQTKKDTLFVRVWRTLAKIPANRRALRSPLRQISSVHRGHFIRESLDILKAFWATLIRVHSAAFSDPLTNFELEIFCFQCTACIVPQILEPA